MESNCNRKEFTPENDAESEQKKILKDTVTCTVKNADVKLEACENGPWNFPRPRVRSQGSQNRSERCRLKGITRCENRRNTLKSNSCK